MRQPRRADRVRVVSYLPADLVASIDALASELSLSRSEAVASLLEEARTAHSSPLTFSPSEHSEPAPKKIPSEPPASPSQQPEEELPPEPPPKRPAHEFQSDLMRRKYGQS